jgi:hypothetical protein
VSVEPLGVRVKRTLRLGPAETLNVARRQVAGRVTPVWGRVEKVARKVPAPQGATATYFGVPDGHTFNLQALLPAAEVSSAEVVFRHGRTEHRAPATLRAGHDGEWYAESTVLFGDRPGAIPLGRGAWHVRIVMTGPSGEKRSLAVRRPQPEPQRTGPTLTSPPSPDTGTRYRPIVSTMGNCRIVVTPGKPAAEVVRLAVDPGKAEISGRFIGVGKPAGAVAEFHRNGDSTVRESTVQTDQDLFRIPLPLAALVPAPGAEEIWEIRVRLADGSRLQVGRFLHDLRHIRRTLRPYEKPMLVPGGAMFHLKLQYTLAGRLNLICTSADPGEHA